MEEEQQGVSLLEIIKIIFSQKWLALIIAVAITALGTLALYFGYNAAATQYSRTFTIGFPGISDSSPTYPDNTPFNYRELTSRENLRQACNSDQKFSGIDVDGLYTNGDVSIVREISELGGETTYTITVGAKYFSNKQQAEEFISALAKAPVTYVAGLAVDQDVYIRDIDSTSFYEDKVDMLNRQMGYVKSNLNDISSRSGGTLKTNCIQLNTRLELFEFNLNTAIVEMRENLYVHNVEEVKASYSAQLSILESQLRNSMREVEIIYGRLQSTDPTIDLAQSSERVEELAAQIAQTESRIAVYSAYIHPQGDVREISTNEQFNTKLTELAAELEAITERYTNLLGVYYKAYSFISYDGPVTANGRIGGVVSLIISAAAGVVIAAIAAYVVGYNKSKGSITSAEQQVE